MESGLQTAGSRHRAECSGWKVKHIGSQRCMNYIYTETEGRTEYQTDKSTGEKNTICAGQVEPRLVALTVGAALQTGPSDRCPLQVGLDASFQAHVLLLHGVESVAHRVHHLHHVDLAVGQQLQHTHKREERMHIYIYEQRPRTERVPNDSICLFSSWHCLEFTGSNACMCRTEFARQKPTLAYIACHFLLCVSRVRT